MVAPWKWKTQVAAGDVEGTEVHEGRSATSRRRCAVCPVFLLKCQGNSWCFDFVWIPLKRCLCHLAPFFFDKTVYRWDIVGGMSKRACRDL